MTKLVLAGAVVLCGLSACGSSPFVGRTVSGRNPDRAERAALERAAAEIQCPPEELVIEPLGGGGYRVIGCSRYIVYTCVRVPSARMGGSFVCDPAQAGPVVVAGAPIQEIVAPPPPAAPPPAPAIPDAELAAARAAVDSHAAVVLACVPDAAIALDVLWDAAGTMTISIPARAGSAEEACVRAGFASARIAEATVGGHVLHPVVRP